MKQVLVVVAIACAGTLLAFDSAQAQEQDAPHVFVITTQKMAYPEGGRNAERDSLMGLYHEHVTKKNTHIISQRALQHYYGSDNRDMVWITEYKDWAAVDAAGKMDTELFEKHWADAASRREFNQKLNKYFGMHSDEIYNERSKMRK